MAKYSRLRERILAEGIVAAEDLHEAPAAELDVPWSAQMVERSRRSVGATIAAARVALDEGVSANLDVALADGTGDEEYLALLRRHLGDVLNQQQPDFVFYLAGDAHDVDAIVTIHSNTLRAASQLTWHSSFVS